VTTAARRGRGFAGGDDLLIEGEESHRETPDFACPPHFVSPRVISDKMRAERHSHKQANRYDGLRGLPSVNHRGITFASNCLDAAGRFMSVLR
jgi:hypothetical protein